MKFKQGFTLIEVILTMVIMSILIGVLFQVYIVIGRMAVFIQGQKELHNELIFVVQTIQNMVDDQDVELFNLGSPDGQDGFVNQLKFSDDAGRAGEEIIIENNEESEINFLQLRDVSETPEQVLNLTNTGSVHISQFLIRKLPLVNQNETASFEERMHDGFWLFMKVEVPFYDETKWWFRISQEIQLFFTLRKY